MTPATHVPYKRDVTFTKSDIPVTIAAILGGIAIMTIIIHVKFLLLFPMMIGITYSSAWAWYSKYYTANIATLSIAVSADVVFYRDVSLYFTVFTYILVSFFLNTLIASLKRIRRVTEETAHALETTNARTSAMFLMAPIGVITMDHAGYVVNVNAIGAEVFGYTRDEMINRELSRLIIPAHNREAHRAGLKKYISDGTGPILNSEVTLTAMHKSGENMDVQIRITPIVIEPRRSGDERTVFFVGFLQNSSAKKTTTIEPPVTLPLKNRTSDGIAERVAF